MEKSTKPVTADSVCFTELTDAEMETTTGGGNGVAREAILRGIAYKRGESSRDDLLAWDQSLSPGKQSQVVNVFNYLKSVYTT